MEQIVRFPIPKEELDRLKVSVASSSEKVEAIVFGHGLWSNLELKQTLDWFDTVLRAIDDAKAKRWYGLFVTPNAAGKEKPDDWIVTQGNKALMLFEEAIAIEAGKRGIEHLGTWNMSIQSNKYDGVHLDMKGNLVKAMMVINWLNLIEPKTESTRAFIALRMRLGVLYVSGVHLLYRWNNKTLYLHLGLSFRQIIWIQRLFRNIPSAGSHANHVFDPRNGLLPSMPRNSDPLV